MDIADIIKESFMFPANNLKALAIYIAVTFVSGLLVMGGIFTTLFAIDTSAFLIVSALLFIIAIVIGFILSGYEISVIKTGIDFEDEAPEFEWKENLITGIKAVIVSIVYFIIPAIITCIVAFLTNVPGNVVNVAQSLNETVANTNGTVVASTAIDMVPNELLANLIGSISITILIAVILFIIFSFIQYMANARLANTDSLGEALNIPEAFKDISRIGYGKVIATVILMFIIVMLITGILGYIYHQVPQLAILNIIVTPFLMFAVNRANGLLYSDIA